MKETISTYCYCSRGLGSKYTLNLQTIVSHDVKTYQIVSGNITNQTKKKSQENPIS